MADTTQTNAAETRATRKTRTGLVVSDKMQKTVVVAIERRVPHPVYGKMVTRTKRVKAHDEENSAKTGDTVRIAETRPLSKDKRWRVVEIVRARALKEIGHDPARVDGQGRG
jgi:small subunit ribosomal protein S17